MTGLINVNVIDYQMEEGNYKLGKESRFRDSGYTNGPHISVSNG